MEFIGIWYFCGKRKKEHQRNYGIPTGKPTHTEVLIGLREILQEILCFLFVFLLPLEFSVDFPAIQFRDIKIKCHSCPLKNDIECLPNQNVFNVTQVIIMIEWCHEKSVGFVLSHSSSSENNYVSKSLYRLYL